MENKTKLIFDQTNPEIYTRTVDSNNLSFKSGPGNIYNTPVTTLEYFDIFKHIKYGLLEIEYDDDTTKFSILLNLNEIKLVKHNMKVYIYCDDIKCCFDFTNIDDDTKFYKKIRNIYFEYLKSNLGDGLIENFTNLENSSIET